MQSRENRFSPCQVGSWLAGRIFRLQEMRSQVSLKAVETWQPLFAVKVASCFYSDSIVTFRYFPGRHQLLTTIQIGKYAFVKTKLQQ